MLEQKPKIHQWLYDQYYEHVHWRFALQEPRNTTVTVTARVVSVIRVTPDGTVTTERFE